MMKKILAVISILLVVAVIIILVITKMNEQNNKIDDSTVSQKNKTAIGFIGDSITWGYPFGVENNAITRIINILGPSYYALNEGVNGVTASQYLKNELLKTVEDFKKHNVEVVNIMLGTNDANTINNQSYYKYKESMKGIISTLKYSGVKKIILNEPIYFSTKGLEQWTEKSVSRISDYREIIRDLAKKDKTVILGDTKGWETFEKDPYNLLSDGVHPTEQGYQVLANLWMPKIIDSLISIGKK